MTRPEQHYRYITDYLAKLYDTALYEHRGTPHPVIFHPAGAEHRTNLNSILGQPPREHQSDFAFYNYAYLHTLQNSARHLYNGTTFVLKRLRMRPLQLDAAYGHYYDMIATCAALDAELQAAATQRFIRVPMRTQFHRTVLPQRALTTGDGRSATIGGDVLVVYNDGDTYRALLARRTARQALRPNQMHVIPAFIFQPHTETMQPHEWDFEYHVMREWLEELFGLPEHTPFDAHPAYIDWQRMAANGDAALYLTGVAMNLLTLRPEICVLMLIHDADWWQRITAQNSSIPLHTQSETAGDLIHFDINGEPALAPLLPDGDYRYMPPQALVALWEGVRLARDIVG